MAEDEGPDPPRPADISGTAYPTKAMREWMEKMKQEAKSDDNEQRVECHVHTSGFGEPKPAEPVDPALVDEGWWIVRYGGEPEVMLVERWSGIGPMRVSYFHIAEDDLTPTVEELAKDGAQFFRKLDPEKLVGGA